MNELPTFIPYPFEKAQGFALRVFNHGEKPEDSHLIRVIAYEDHHFRAIFRLAFFTLADGQSQPSKSQWNTLKKRIKRMNNQAFIFKEYGEIVGEGGYIDFGFLPA